VSNHSLSREDAQVIRQIAKRAGEHLDSIETFIQVATCHTGPCPLKLQELLEADDLNFIHDICGIKRNLDTQKGELLDCFLPRYAV